MQMLQQFAAHLAGLRRLAPDLHGAFAAARAAIDADPRILAEPAPALAIADITERGIVLSVQVWSKSAQSGDVRGELLQHLHAQLRERGIALAQQALPPAGRLGTTPA